MVERGNDFYISIKRIETLVDGIFAIALTLMVLNLHLPDPSGIWTNPMVWNVLWGQANNFFVYALTFFILISFWVSHHRGFDQLKRADRGLFWLNAVWLFFVALTPFSTSLAGDFSSNVPAALFFNTNMFLLGIFSFLIRRHVIEHELSDKPLGKDEIEKIYANWLTFPVMAFLGIILSLVIPDYSYIVYLLNVIVHRILHKILGT
jgi:uncharacterized membrane protein